MVEKLKNKYIFFDVDGTLSDIDIKIYYMEEDVQN